MCTNHQLGLIFFFSILYCCYSEQQRVSQHSVSITPINKTLNNRNMFTVPTKLRESNSITIRGKMIDNMFNIELRPDLSQHNVVCKINVVFRDENNEGPDNQVLLSNVYNGITEISQKFNASDYFSDNEFDIRFLILSDYIHIMTEEVPLGLVPMKHSIDDIQYISVIGSVELLTFKFLD